MTHLCLFFLLFLLFPSHTYRHATRVAFVVLVFVLVFFSQPSPIALARQVWVRRRRGDVGGRDGTA